MKRLLLILLLGLLLVVALSPWWLPRLLGRLERNVLLDGRELAGEVGCDGCHRPYRGEEIPNPGSRWGSVPRFEAGNVMMYAESRREIEEFIRYGAPRAWTLDPEVVGRLAAQRIRMPAYEERLSEREIAALTAWASAVEGVDLPGGEAVDAGRELARSQGCLSCHGLEGSGGLPNPGSLGGFIPGFLGRNFEHMVSGRDEFEEWVRTGELERLAANPIVRRAWRRQTISMPAYGDALTDEDLDRLWAWVEAIRRAYREG